MPYVRQDYNRANRAVVNATLKGATRLSTTKWEWDISGRCEKPVLIQMTGRPAANWLLRHKYIVVGRRGRHPLHMDLWTRCRKCRPCMKARMSLWAARAMHEVRNATRTWFATLTLSPQSHYVMQLRGLQRARERSIPEGEIAGQDLLERATAEIQKEVTLFLKRVRKESGSLSVRYLLVRENHKSGLAHFHLLLHEQAENAIKHAVLTKQWSLGFSKFKLMEDEAAAFYVVKYLGKSNDGRVRASIRYGRTETASAIARALAKGVSGDVNEQAKRSKVNVHQKITKRVSETNQRSE